MLSKVAVGCGIGAVFAITVLVLDRVLPSPHKPTDYLVMGTLATFLCLAILVALFYTKRGRNRDLFYKRRK